MPNSRRKFLKTGVLTALFAALPLKNVLGQSWKDRDGNPANNPESHNDPLGNYSKATFKSYLNSVFALHTVTGIVGVTLLRVDDMPASKGGECFSLLFRGGSRRLRQDTYTLVHPSLGTFQLLLVPTGTDDNGAQGYLATINRLSYVDALANPAPSGSSTAQRSGSTQSPPAATPSTTNTSPTATPPAQPTNPVMTTPGESPKPAKRKHRKTSWKNNDYEDFDGELN